MTNDLFDAEEGAAKIDMPDADVCLYDSFFPAKEANRLFDALLQETDWEETDWEQKEIKHYGKTHSHAKIDCLPRRPQQNLRLFRCQECTQAVDANADQDQGQDRERVGREVQ